MSASRCPILRTCADDLTAEEQALVAKVWSEGKCLYRELPWRNIDDPYAVMVSEIMLQQTQVARVENYWQRFMMLFPTVEALANAETSLVLEMWQGLGYNRRALMLKRAAETCAQEYGGTLPKTYAELLSLPGVGKATAGGIMAFAYQQPALYLETNVRTVFIHELFPGRESVSDKELEPHIQRTCSVEDPRGWYYALLDYGSYLKSKLPNPSRRSKHHTKQSKFEGSRRQKRAELVRFVLAERETTFPKMVERLSEFEKQQGREAPSEELVRSIIDDLVKEGFFTQSGKAEGARYSAC